MAGCKRGASHSKRGRKYGAGIMIVSQRPSEIDPTILSQCGTIFAMRLQMTLTAVKSPELHQTISRAYSICSRYFAPGRRSLSARL